VLDALRALLYAALKGLAVSFEKLLSNSTPPCGSVFAAVCQSALSPSILAGTIAILSSRAFKSAFGGLVSLYRYPLL